MDKQYRQLTSLNALDALDHLTPSWSDRYALAEFISLPRLLINYLILPICEEMVKGLELILIKLGHVYMCSSASWSRYNVEIHWKNLPYDKIKTT